MRRTLNNLRLGSHRNQRDGDESDHDTHPVRPRPMATASVPTGVPGSKSIKESQPRSSSTGQVPGLDAEDDRRCQAGEPSSFFPLSGASSFSQSNTRSLVRTWSSATGVHGPSLAPTNNGLYLVQEPTDPEADLILVHGLGGSPIKTWAYERDPERFWPVWLGSHETLSKFRIFSFGYNANFAGPGNSMGILDFAKDLLMNMSGYGSSQHKIGQIPIFFVAHSMGGLVVKKAYILGMLNDEFSDMITRVLGVIFLSTPHKGSDFAHTLNNILSASMVSSAKVYVSELGSHSPTLRDINEQFRLVCKQVRLVSFYETLKTRVGSTKKLIVDSNSGILGYPTEISAPMMADHHNVCKYRGLDDPNFILLTNTLRGFATRFCVVESDKPSNEDESAFGSRDVDDEVWPTLSRILGVQETDDVIKTHELEGTCLWIRQRPCFLQWRDDPVGNFRILWLTGLPGCGKSTLARAIIGSLPRCQHHFFSFSDTTKRKTGHALRSIAFQVAKTNDKFRQRLLHLYEKPGMRFEQLDTHVIWARIFEGILFKIDFQETMYWVLDGLDESDTPLSFLPMLFNARPKSPLRILLLSRPSPNLMNLAPSRSSFLTNVELTEKDTRDDIGLYVRTRVQESLPLEDDVKEHISGQVFEKASGSFLWAKLALDSLEQSWHTEDDIRRALGDIPGGMQSLYGRMLHPIQALRTENPRNYLLARRILSWVTCAEEPLTPHELAVALEPEFTKLQNLGATISHLCGHFLVTSDAKIMPIHETARSFLLTHQVDQISFLDGPTCHEHLATVCINYMCSDSWRNSLVKIENAGSWSNLVSHNRLSLFLSENRFLRYAVCHWAYHVSHASPESNELLSLLHGFFDEYILTWIHACVMVADLRVITRTAQHIKAYGKKQASRSMLDSPAGFGRRDAQFFQSWATDLIRMVGRFGRNLIEKPSSIYKIIPPLCPHGSQIHTTYAITSNLAVHGISSDVWDDCVARLPIGEERTISRILSGVTYFICLLAVGGEIIVCRSETFEEARRMHHGEYVTHMTINKSGDLLVTAGINTFRIWEVATGEEVHRFPKGKSGMTMTIAFGSADTELIVAYDDCSVVCYDVGTLEVVWDFLAVEDSDEYHPCPREMVLSPNQTKIAVDIRGRPVAIWDLGAKADGPRHCMRAGDQEAQDQFCALVDSTRWHPDGLSVLVLFQDSLLARFFLTDEATVETLETGAKDMVVNHDGSLLLTSNHAGSLSLWSLPHFNLAYRLHYEGFVRGLAFSPDGQRFYDVRGPLCNVWEPDVLLRADQEDPEGVSSTGRSDTGFSDPVFAADDTVRSQITAVVSSASEEHYVCGTDDGTVSLYDTNTGKRIRKLYSHSNTASIITVAWSPKRKYVASCDDLGRIIVKRLEIKVELGKTKWAVFPALDIRDDEPVNQFVFNTNRKLVLMAFAGSDRIWNLKTRSQVWRCNRSAALPIRWIQHPAKDNQLLCVQHDGTTIHDWDVERVHTPESSAPASSAVPSDGDAGEDATRPREHTGGRVRYVVQSDDQRHIISEVLPQGPRSKCPQLEILATDDMLGKETGQSIKGKVLTVSKHVRRLLGCYKNQVVFLDHQYWVCTWPLGQASGTPRRHFFLPRDCIGPSAIPLISFATGPTILFPKNGEMTIVRNGINI